MPKHILLLDDDNLIRDNLKFALELEGYEVTTVVDASKGINALSAQNFDLVITDLSMPILDGISFIQEFRDYSETLPIIVVSGDFDEARRNKALELGANEFLPKPIDDEFLIRRVADLLN